jgi:hypothetical protein
VAFGRFSVRGSVTWTVCATHRQPQLFTHITTTWRVLSLIIFVSPLMPGVRQALSEEH